MVLCSRSAEFGLTRVIQVMDSRAFANSRHCQRGKRATFAVIPMTNLQVQRDIVTRLATSKLDYRQT